MKYLILFVFLGFGNSLFAQTLITGILKTVPGKTVENANVILYELKNDNIVAYSISDQKGNFSLSFSHHSDSLRLEISLIGFEKMVKSIANKKGQHYPLTLVPATTILADVLIKQEPIQITGDTINYLTKSFADKSDRVIIDVIRKLPGIQVTKTGQILFNNKSINKFYIDGKDLLESRYSIASNNLSTDAVEQIQVLQHHQPISLLNGIDASDRAAINIKLNKNAKTKLLANGHVGLGIAPLATDNSLALLKFSKEIQFINTVKHNNVGLNLDQEINDQSLSAALYASAGINQELVSLVKASPPPINQERYWFNNNTLATGNYLLGISKTFDLKFNAAFEHDQLREQASAITRIYLAEDTITIHENHNGLSGYYKLQTGLTLQANTKKIFLKNTLQLQRIWSNGTDLLTPANINQELKNPFVNLSNDLAGMLKIGNNLIGINSYTTYTNMPQRLQISPGQFPAILNANEAYDGLLQKVQLKGFFTDNAATYRNKTGKLSFSNKLGILVQLQTLNNDLNTLQHGALQPLDDRFNNEIRRNRVRVYNEANVNLSSNGFNLSFGLKTSINALENTDKSSEESTTRFFLNPNLNLRYMFNSFWETNINAATSNNIGYNGNSSFILQNYRSLQRNDIPLQESGSKNISYGLSYKNIINAVYSNLELSYALRHANTIMSTRYDGILSTRTALLQDNPYTDFNLGWNINKYYLFLKTAFNLSLKYDNIKSKQLQQGVLIDFLSNNYMLSTTINSKIGKKIVLEHALDLTIDKTSSKSGHEEQRYATVTYLKQHLMFKYFFQNEFQTHLNLEQYHNNAGNLKGLNYYFADLTLQRSMIKPKLDFSITLANVFNTRSYHSYLNDNNTLFISDYKLRGRMLMCKVGFQFN